MRLKIIVTGLLILPLCVGTLHAQQGRRANRTPAPAPAAATPAAPAAKAQPAASSDTAPGGVLMLEEIRIEVSPELPTVVVTIPREKPEITSVVLKKDAEDLIHAGSVQVKPRLADLQINQLEEPEKVLAKVRAQ